MGNLDAPLVTYFVCCYIFSISIFPFAQLLGSIFSVSLHPHFYAHYPPAPVTHPLLSPNFTCILIEACHCYI